MERQGVTFEYHEVSAHVLLGDSTTRQEIKQAVMLHLKFIGPNGKVYTAPVYCYVLDAPNTTQVILGLLCTSFYQLFLEILKEGYKVFGASKT